MSRIRDIASILTSANVLSTDVETSAAITAAINALPPGYGRGNTASRPVSPTVGDIYVNTQTGFVEIYESTGWSQVGGAASVVTGVTATNTPTSRAYNNGAASIAFTPGTILGKTYTVTSSPGSYTASGSVSPITITGLQSSTQYTYTIVASNNYGTAAASSASSAVTATTVPQAPTIGTATAANAQASVTFTANATGGSAITGYTVTSSGGQTASGVTSPITVTGLTNGTSYTFSAVATNANGTSLASAASNSVAPLSNPIIDYLVVAGGGGGGAPGSGGTGGGGGGAGGYRNFTSQSLALGTPYSVIVGGGGASQTKGENSVFNGNTSTGGGKGGGLAALAGGPGGSGGSGADGFAPGSGNQGGYTPVEGYAGGNSSGGGGWYGGGGGGGSSAVGSAGSDSTNTGTGGEGTANSITGSSVIYAGGGGGGVAYSGNNGSNGGVGGGGKGGSSGVAGVAGTANTGGGGGGGSGQAQSAAGAGGSGVIIIRALQAAASVTGSPVATTSGSYYIYKFTGTGSITF